MVTLGLSNYGSFLFTILFKSAAYGLIVDKLVMHPCVPFCSGAPLIFFGALKCAPCTPVEEYWFRPLCKVRGFVIDCIVLCLQV